MNAEVYEHVIRIFFAQLAAGHVETSLAYVADDATVSVLGKLEKFPLAGTRTKAQMGALLQWMFAAVVPKGVQITLEEMTVEGDHATVAAKVCAETASGRVYTQYHQFSFKVYDGKVQAMREYAVVRTGGRERLGERESREMSFPPCVV